MGDRVEGDGVIEVEMVNESVTIEEMVQETELFQTATGKARKRNVVSYKEALGVNGGYNSSSSDSEDERHEACRPWRKALIVKVLGKRVGLRFLHLRLLKLWNPVGEIEASPAIQKEPVAAAPGGDNSTKGQNGEEAFGPWILVGRQKRRQSNNSARGSHSGSGAKRHDAVMKNMADPNGSRFDVLMEDYVEGDQVVQEHAQEVDTQIEEERIVTIKGPQEDSKTTSQEPQNMDVDGLKLGQGDNIGPNKESGPKSFQEIKSSARGKSKDDGSDGGSIKVAKGKSIPPPNLKEKVVVSGPEGKENIGPKSDISLRPNYKKAKAPFKEKEIPILASISTGPE
ncbi:hypothetical protein SESBI_43424, partial [Sesbania bispinosa]